jgi:hypothetical protein
MTNTIHIGARPLVSGVWLSFGFRHLVIDRQAGRFVILVSSFGFSEGRNFVIRHFATAVRL